MTIQMRKCTVVGDDKDTESLKGGDIKEREVSSIVVEYVMCRGGL